MEKIFGRSPSTVSSLTKTKRDVALGFKRSPLLRWLYRTKEVSQLLLVPRDLRTADPSLSIELDMGQFGLAGATVLLEGRSPFFVDPPNVAWQKDLHGFVWLRNLRAARSDRALNQAQDLVEHWLLSFKDQSGLAWQPEIAARRLINFLSYSNFILHDVSDDMYLEFMHSIDSHMKYLSMSRNHVDDGMPRLLSLIALVFAGLCVADQERFADTQIRALCYELDRQILADGGHISRNNSVLASLLLDLLPLKQCFVSRNLDLPHPLIDAINRIHPMINYMRMGDGLLSRFNGSGVTMPDTLSTAMAYDDVATKALQRADISKYFRLERGNVIVLMDGGSAPSLALSKSAHAGCLSFEMSSGSCPVIVNCGAAPPSFQTMSYNARATVSHSTLTVNNRSSSEFLHDKKLSSSELPSLLSGPMEVTAAYEQKQDQYKIIGSHDGYRSQYGLVHHRLLSLSQDGYVLSGEDWIEVPHQSDSIQMGLGWPYAVHFHIHPDVKPSRGSNGTSIRLELPDSQVWELTANDAIIHLEESTFYADFAGPCLSVQAVIRGNCTGPTSIPWKLAKVIETQTPDAKKVPAWFSENVIPLEKAADDEGAKTASKKTDEDLTQETTDRPEKTEDDITDLIEDNRLSDQNDPRPSELMPQKELKKTRTKKNRRSKNKRRKTQKPEQKDGSTFEKSGDKSDEKISKDKTSGLRAEDHAIKKGSAIKPQEKSAADIQDTEKLPGLAALPTLDASALQPPPPPKAKDDSDDEALSQEPPLTPPPLPDLDTDRVKHRSLQEALEEQQKKTSKSDDSDESSSE